MFYKDGVLSKEEKNDYRDNYKLELTWNFYERMISCPDVKMGVLKDSANNTVTPLVGTEGKRGFYVFTIDGSRILTNLLNEYSKQKQETFTFEIQDKKYTKESFEKEFGKMSDSKLTKVDKMLDNFHVKKEEGFLTNKNGEEFKYIINKNSDPTLGDILALDSINIYHEDKKIGYMKIQYTNLDIYKKITGKDFALLDKNKKITEQDKDNLLRVFKETPDEFNKDFLFDKCLKQLKEEQKIFIKKYDRFLNIGCPDYSYIDEQYQNTGLGTAMYLKAAEFMGSENMKFRSSSLRSPDAKRIWSSLREKYPKAITEKKYGEDVILIFEYPKQKQKLKIKP